MNGNVPPAFKFERGHVNHLEFFIVEEIAPENQGVSYMDQDIDKNIVLWQIWPKTSDDGRVDKLPIITYGEVPVGFSQKIPGQRAPPALIEGRVYEAGGPPVTMSKGFLRFVIKDGNLNGFAKNAKLSDSIQVEGSFCVCNWKFIHRNDLRMDRVEAGT